MKLCLVVALVAAQCISAAPVDEEAALIAELENQNAFSAYSKMNDFFNIQNWDDIKDRSDAKQYPKIAKFIEGKVGVYYSIDPAKAMGDLAGVGSLLRLAYSGSKGYPCSTPILSVMSTYQDLIKHSLITSSTFVEITLKALRYHKYALLFAEIGKGSAEKMKKSLKFLRMCSQMATAMAAESQKLIDEADRLTQKSQEALLQVNNDYNGDRAEKRRIEEMIANATAAREKEEYIKKNLALQIADAKKKEQENAALATERSVVGFIVLITHGTDIDADKQSAARKLAEESRKLRVKLQEEELKNNANLAATLQRLISTQKTASQLERTIKSLDLTIKIMGRVKTIFLNAKTFWVGIKKHLDSLAASPQELEFLANEPELYQNYVEGLQTSGFSWLAIGKICRMSALTIREVNKGIDADMNNIPSEEEAKKLVEVLGPKILKRIEEDKKEIDAELNSKKNQPKPAPTTFLL